MISPRCRDLRLKQFCLEDIAPAILNLFSTTVSAYSCRLIGGFILCFNKLDFGLIGVIVSYHNKRIRLICICGIFSLNNNLITNG